MLKLFKTKKQDETPTIVDLTPATTPQPPLDYIENWFSNRKENLSIREYQLTIIRNLIIATKLNQYVKMLIAASPAAGKSFMSIAYIDWYLSVFPHAKILVLTHGRKLLRKQWVDYCMKANPNFIYEEITKDSKNFTNTNANVFVAIPNTIHNLNLPHFDLILFDEAHEFYHADMVQNIIAKTKPKHQLLLTGTPAVFIRENLEKKKIEYLIQYISYFQLLKMKLVSNILVEMCTSSYKYTKKNYNQDNRLENNIRFDVNDTIQTLEDLLYKFFYKRLIHKYRNNPVKYLQITLGKFNLEKILGMLTKEDIGKTMIYCASIEQAKQVYIWFLVNNYSAAISVSETVNISFEKDGKVIKKTIFDDDSEIKSFENKLTIDDIYNNLAKYTRINDLSDEKLRERNIERFTDEQLEQRQLELEYGCDFLVVVDRGTLGYDNVKIYNSIDLSGSMNITDLHQTILRLGRVDPDVPYDKQQKIFFKVVSKEMSDYAELVVSAALALCDEYYLSSFIGGKLSKISTLVYKKYDELTKKTTTQTAFSVARQNNIEFNMSLFSQLLHKKDNFEGTGYCFVDFNTANNLILNIHSKYDIILQMCIDEKIQDFSSFRKKYTKEFDYLKGANLIQKLCDAMQWTNTVIELDVKWNNKYIRLSKHLFDNNNKYPSRSSTNKDEIELRYWIDKQQVYFKKCSLSNDRIVKLESLPNWKWNTDLEADWLVMFEYVETFYKNTGRYPIKKDDKKAKTWIDTQKMFKDTMSNDRLILLNTLPDFFKTYEDIWFDNFIEYELFINNNDGRYPTKTTNEKLSDWAKVQNYQIKNKTISTSKLEYLKSLPDNTNTNFGSLKNFKNLIETFYPENI